MAAVTRGRQCFEEQAHLMAERECAVLFANAFAEFRLASRSSPTKQPHNSPLKAEAPCVGCRAKQRHRPKEGTTPGAASDISLESHELCQIKTILAITHTCCRSGGKLISQPRILRHASPPLGQEIMERLQYGQCRACPARRGRCKGKGRGCGTANARARCRTKDSVAARRAAARIACTARSEPR